MCHPHGQNSVTSIPVKQQSDVVALGNPYAFRTRCADECTGKWLVLRAHTPWFISETKFIDLLHMQRWIKSAPCTINCESKVTMGV